MIVLPVVDGRVIVWDINHIKLLRENYNICGVLTGVLPQFPQQNVFQGLPLQLMPEDVKYLRECGAIELVDDALAQSSNFEDEGAVERSSRAVKLGGVSSKPQVPLTTSYELPDEAGYTIFKYLIKRGYYLLPGLRFGCQYMAYPGDIVRYHSHFNVQAFYWNQKFPILEITGCGRLGTTVKKCWVVGAKPPDSEIDEPRIFSVEWAGFG